MWVDIQEYDIGACVYIMYTVYIHIYSGKPWTGSLILLSFDTTAAYIIYNTIIHTLVSSATRNTFFSQGV